MAIAKKLKAGVAGKKKTKITDEAPAKKVKKTKITDEAPAKKVKKTKIADEAPAKKVKKKVKDTDEAPAKKVKKVAKGSSPEKGGKVKRVAKIIENTASPVKERMNRTQQLTAICEGADLASLFGKKFELSERLERKLVAAVLKAQEDLILGSIHKKGLGHYTFANLFKIVTRKIEAKPRRKGINPFTKVEQWFEAKPATVRVKLRPMKRLKDAAL